MSTFEIPEEDLKTARTTTINWMEQIDTLVDGYRSNGRGVLHGVQKDAIQNSWGARKEDKGREWMVYFELVETPKSNLLVIEDCGTFGLTGRVLRPEEYLEDLAAGERWGRFESLAFSSGQSSKVLGSRGRGKFIFVGASEDHTIFYDTLREDGSYRFGFRTVTQTESPVNAFDGDKGREKLTEYTEGFLKPIDHVGTRVFIVNPIDELVRGFDSGGLERAISETWWEIIKEFGATIKLVHDGTERTVNLPKELALGTKETANIKVWHKKDQSLKIGRRTFKVKELYMVCDKTNPVPDDIRGIGIQRSGMKICPIFHEFLPKDISDGLFGYVIVDKELEEELLKDESPEHYSFVFNKVHPRDLRDYVRREINTFCREKLGFGLDTERIEKERTKNAERRALNAINSIASRLGFAIGPTTRPPGPPPPPPIPTPIKLVMPQFEFPRENGRINHGEDLGGIELSSVNNKDALSARIQVEILFGESHIKKLFEIDKTVKNGEHLIFGPKVEKITREDYPTQGKYTVHAKMVSLEKEDKGTVLDEINRHFYVEQDPPPIGGVFEDCVGRELPEEFSHITGFHEQGSRSGMYVFTYNLNHPAEKVAGQDEDTLTDYLVLLMALSLPAVDLDRYGEDSKLFTGGSITGGRVAKEIPDIVGRVLQVYFNQ